MTEHAAHLAQLLIELGCAIVGLAVLARLASRIGLPAIPLYLLAGLAFGNGGIAPLPLSGHFIATGSEIGVLLLLFMLGLEYTGEELVRNLRGGFVSGAIDFALNFTPGLAAGFLLRWKPLASVLLGGVTWISSSGIAAKVLGDLGRLANRETPALLAVLVMEDLAMAVYLPLVGALLVGGSAQKIALAVSVALAVVLAVLFAAVRFGGVLSRVAAHESDEIILLTVLGAVLIVAGLAEKFQVSTAIGAFLVGIAVSGPLAERSHHLFSPLRDLFAATFFFFFGLEIDPHSLAGVLPVGFALAVVTMATKILTGYFATRNWRAGAAIAARGEFSIVIAGLGAAVEPKLGLVAAAYVLITAIAGPILARVV
ncbi:MAG TPA: cation:proton antiporter [Bryobacteraceae bacterium]|jgi:CPA2 family monovalent cation:H+ antiporter-2|nr:cation:proton antiporter [Bryobacteraceae bacterium]